MDRFKDSFQRILNDIKPTQYFTYDGMSGNYENELVKKLIEVFQDARIL